MDPSLIGQLYANDEEEQSDGESDEDIASEKEVDVVVGSRRVGKVRRAKINDLGFKNIWELGNDMMNRKNLRECRQRARQRERRQRDSLRDILYKDVGSPEGEDDTLRGAWERLDSICSINSGSGQ
jgi:hypothetical protein